MLGDFTNNIILPVPKGVKRPLWSVMMPTYNPKDYIFEALESVLKQYPDDGSMQLEIIDDCSTKVDIPKIIEKIDDKRISYYRNPKNVGHSFNFTEAVRKSRGHLVHILHDDDLVKPGFYETFAGIFEEYKEIGAAYCRQEYIDDDGKTMFFSEPDLEKTGILDNALIKLAEKQRVQYCAMVVRRSAYEKVGGYVMKNIGCEDWEMWVRIASQFDIAYEPEALAKYRIHTTSMTLTDMRSGQDMRFLREAADIFTKYLPEEKQDEVSKKRNVHYGNYSFENAKKLFKQYDDEQGAAAQLSETIILDSNRVYSNLDLISEFKVPITGMGVSVVIPVSKYDVRIANTIRQLANLRKFDYIPVEIILVDGSGNKETKKTALEAVERFRLKTPFKIVDSECRKYFSLIDNGINSSKYNFVVINNPGVFLDLNYLKISSESMLMANDIGAIGGRVDAIADIDIPAWITEYRKVYGVGEVLPLSGLLTDPSLSLLGSGIIIRKEAWESLISRNFRFGSETDDTSAENFFKQLSSGLRLSGWRLYVNNDLKSKKHFEEVHLGWKNLRALQRISGKGFLVGKYYINLQQKIGKKKLADFSEATPRKRNTRKKIRKAYHHLRKQNYWNGKYFDSSLTGSKQVLVSEKYLGLISDLLNDVPTYARRLKLIKRIAYKCDLKLLRTCFGTTSYDYPNYPRKNCTKGITLVMLNRSEYMPNLYGAIRDLTYQNLPNGFRWEVVIFGKPIDAEAQRRIQEILNTSPITVPIDYYRDDELNFRIILKNYADSFNFENLILIGENDRLRNDYVRNAYRFMNSQQNVAAVGGSIEYETSVAAPKWLNIYKSMYCQKDPSEYSGYDTSTEALLAPQGIVVRKSALNKAINTVGEDTDDSAFSKSLLHAFRNNGWEISYQSRLKLRHIIYEKDLRWEVMRKNFRMLGISENIPTKDDCGSEIVSTEGSRFGEIVNTVSKLNKYPFGKIFSEKNEFRGDSEILEIEKLKGRLSKLTGFGNGHNGKSGNWIKLPLLQQEKKVKKPEIIRGVSVVICCYNSEKVLPMTLNFLCAQNVPHGIPWEIIIVDNASTDSTAEVARKIFESSDCLCDFRIVKEINPGLSAARLKGLESAKYEYVIFCDDDNHLDKNFVRHTFDIMSNNEEIGVLGGQSTTEFDVLPKKWFYDWKDSFAIGKQSENDGDITWTRGYVWGASMIVRRSAFRQLIRKGFKSYLTDRKGTALSAGGDTEICYALRNDGWKIWYDSRLMFRHHIPPERLDWKYLRKLFRGFGQASAVLDVYLKKSSVKFKKQFKGKRPRSKTYELRKTLHELRKIRYKKLLTYNRKREGDTDLPMIEYCIGRIEGLISTAGNYNKSLRLLKRVIRKNDLRFLALPFADFGTAFPQYDKTTKLNGVSVIVCTYNGASRLADTFRHIALQKVDPRILWEVILVDNASSDNSKEVVINEWNKHKCNAKLKIVDQPIPGKQLALEKGYQVAEYEYWITCDDDNWLDENFVQLTYEIMSGNDQIGALGGPNEPLCELTPPEWFAYFKRDYAGGPQPDVHTGIVSEGNITWKRGYVWGAGMVVRRAAWEKLLADGFKTSMTCRKGTELSSGGDSEACYALVLAGWQIWYDSRLKLVHCMPGGRLDWDYLVRLFRGFGKATVGLELYEKAILLAHADTDDEEVLKHNWSYEFRNAIKELRKYGLRKILSLRHPQNDNTEILMIEFYLEKLKELYKSRKDYNRNFDTLRKAPWKKEFKYLKAQHRKYIESENDYRYGWPWSENTYAGYNAKKNKSGLPKISVLSPSFNSEGTIEKAIISVLNQGYPNFEHIICDGGSTDGTVEIMKKYPHLNWISEPDKGQSDAMNKAFNMSTGEIIVYLNVDDYFSRGAFFKVAEEFEKDPTADMLISNLFFEFSNHTFNRVPEIEYKKVMLPFKYMFPINPVSYFYKRGVQEKIGPFPLDNHFTMDYWFLLKAYQDFKLIQTDYHLGTFCMNGYNKTSNADNRKNTHIRVMYHCWHYDKKMLPYYMYNYYKHFYYDIKPWNLKGLAYKSKKFISRIYSVITLKKNKYYSQKLYERGRYRYYEKKKVRSVFWTSASFLIYPKSFKSASRWNIFLPALLGEKLGEKSKNAYRFFAYPPGMSLAHKLNYYGNEYKYSKKIFKGNLILLLGFVSSPLYFLRKKDHDTGITYSSGSKSLKTRSQALFDKGGFYYHNKKRMRALMWVLMSLAVYPKSSGQKSRRKLLLYSALGERTMNEANVLRHLYKDDKQYKFTYKLNYYGNKLRKEGSSVYGNFLLLMTYLVAPKYIKEREKIQRSNAIYSSQVQDVPKNQVSKIDEFSGVKINSPDDINKKVKSMHLSGDELFRYSRYKLQLAYDYFRYRKFKAKSKYLYSDAMDFYHKGNKSKVPGLIIPSFLYYPPSLLNRNKWSLLINSVFSDSTLKKIKGGKKN